LSDHALMRACTVAGWTAAGPPLGEVWWALCLVALCCSCSYADDPDLRTEYSSSFSLISSSPAPAEVDFGRAQPIDLVFDAAPDASTVADVEFRVYSGVVEATGAVRVDLLERRLRMHPFLTLRPQLRYQVYLAGAVRGLNGVALGNDLHFAFTTGQQEGEPPRAATQVSAAELQPLWTQRCASCHAGSEPPMAVDLSSPEAARRTTAGVPAPLGWLLVSPGDHARSYLMLKVLAEGGHFGSPMPPDTDRLGREELRRIADWIDGGAQ
jgi:hypothetical protein